MSSDPQSVLEIIQLDSYLCLAIITVVVYDYLLTFSSEVEYIWCKPWTWVSSIFVVIRYVGLCWPILTCLVGTTFVPGPVRVSTAMVLAGPWVFAILYNAGDFVMILRIYAMWHQSKGILWVLLFIFVSQVITTLVFTGIYHTLNTYVFVNVVQIYDVTFCNGSWNVPLSLHLYYLIPQFVLSTALLFLAVIQTLRQSIGMYRATKQWQPNRYIQQFVRDGIFYFFAVMFFNIISTLVDASLFNGTVSSFLVLFYYIAIYPMMPRFVISVRELYDRDLRGHRQGVDTGFGVLSRPVFGQNAAVSTIAFADVASGQDQAVEGGTNESGAIRLETLGDNIHQV